MYVLHDIGSRRIPVGEAGRSQSRRWGTDRRQIQPSNNIPFKHVVDRFRVLPPPHRPYPKDEIWLRGKRVEGRGRSFSPISTF